MFPDLLLGFNWAKTKYHTLVSCGVRGMSSTVESSTEAGAILWYAQIINLINMYSKQQSMNRATASWHIQEQACIWPELEIVKPGPIQF